MLKNIFSLIDDSFDNSTEEDEKMEQEEEINNVKQI